MLWGGTAGTGVTQLVGFGEGLFAALMGLLHAEKRRGMRFASLRFFFSRRREGAKGGMVWDGTDRTGVTQWAGFGEGFFAALMGLLHAEKRRGKRFATLRFFSLAEARRRKGRDALGWDRWDGCDVMGWVLGRIIRYAHGVVARREKEGKEVRFAQVFFSRGGAKEGR